MGSKHVGEGVEKLDGVWWEGTGPFKGRTFEVFVRVGFSRIAVQCEGFPLGREMGVGDGVSERVATLGWLGWQQVWWNGVVDEGRENSGEVMRWYMGSGKGGSGGRCCGVSGDSGMDVYVMGRNNGCLLSGGEGVRGKVVLAFFLTRLVSWRLGGF